MQGCDGTERAPQRAPAAARDLAGLSVASLLSLQLLAWPGRAGLGLLQFYFTSDSSISRFVLEVKASESRTSQLSAPSGRACDTQAGFQHVSAAQTHRPWRNAWRHVKSYKVKVKQYLTDFLISHHASFMKFLSYSNLLTRLLIYRTLWESARSYSNCMQSQTQGELKYEGCIVSRDIAFSSRCLLWTCVYVRPQKQPCQ